MTTADWINIVRALLDWPLLGFLFATVLVIRYRKEIGQLVRNISKLQFGGLSVEIRDRIEEMRERLVTTEEESDKKFDATEQAAIEDQASLIEAVNELRDMLKAMTLPAPAVPGERERLVSEERAAREEELGKLASQYQRDMPFEQKVALARKMALVGRKLEADLAPFLSSQDDGKILAAAATLVQRPERAYFGLLRDDALRQSSGKFVRYRTLMALERLIPDLSENQRGDLRELLVTLAEEPRLKADNAFARRINRVRSALGA